MNLQDRSLLRRQLRRARQALTPSQQQQAAQRLCLRLSHSALWRKSHCIGLYWPADGEISPLPLMRLAWRQRKSVCLPCIDAHTGLMQFHHHRYGQRLKRNRYGIAEPTGAVCQREMLDLVLMPLVGFDDSGNRLGMGGGYYDRFLAGCRGRKPLRLGLAHAVQRLPSLTVADWDIPLHGVFTDRAFHCGRYR